MRWYKIAGAERRLHYSDHDLTKESILFESQGMGIKPTGFWYSIDDAWKSWGDQNLMDVGRKVYEVQVDLSMMLVLSSALLLEEFDRKYRKSLFPGAEKEGYPTIIDWAAVAQEHAGVEFNPYPVVGRRDISWYSAIDVPSGCIWNPSALQGIRLAT